MRGADHDDVADDQRCRVEANLAGIEVELLIVFELQIDGAIAPEGGNRNAGPGIERQQSIAGCDVNDAAVRSIRAGPVGEPASGAVARKR